MEFTKELLVFISPSSKELVFVNIMNSTQNKTTLTTLKETTFTDQQEVFSSQEENKKMKQQKNKKFYQCERYARKRACDPLWVKEGQEKLRKHAKRVEARQKAKATLTMAGRCRTQLNPFSGTSN